MTASVLFCYMLVWMTLQPLAPLKFAEEILLAVIDMTSAEIDPGCANECFPYSSHKLSDELKSCASEISKPLPETDDTDSHGTSGQFRPSWGLWDQPLQDSHYLELLFEPSDCQAFRDLIKARWDLARMDLPALEIKLLLASTMTYCCSTTTQMITKRSLNGLIRQWLSINACLVEDVPGLSVGTRQI